jgi:peptidoglycan/LPS O-acetylase OafA/YrhL
MRQRLDLGSILAALGAALLFVSLFVVWYEPGGTGWQVFEALDLVLAAIAVGVLSAVAVGVGTAPEDRAWWVPALAAVAVAVVAVQLIDPPPAARGTDRVEGAWLALGGALLLVVGALLQRARISISVDVRERDRRQRVPAVDRRDAVADEPQEPAPEATRGSVVDPDRTEPLPPQQPGRPPRG